jgi:hypothetical protein
MVPQGLIAIGVRPPGGADRLCLARRTRASADKPRCFSNGLLADAASRARHRSQPGHRSYSTRAVPGTFNSGAVPAQGGGGYSSNPRTRELEVLADKYRPVGW